jgi:hypothetical protein
MGLLAIYSFPSNPSSPTFKRQKYGKRWSNFGIPLPKSMTRMNRSIDKENTRKVVVGGPVLGSFEKLSTEGTRDFHQSHMLNRRSSRKGGPVPPERVGLRTVSLFFVLLLFRSGS